LLICQERQELAHVLGPELTRVPALEMNHEAPNPMDVRGDGPFAVSTLASAPTHLLE